MAATDARPVPRKNTAFRITFPILDADGDPVASAAGLDSEVSLDGAAFSDCTNEATEIGNGLYYLDLTANEMNADTVALAVKTSTSGAKTTLLVLYPEDAGDYRVDVVQVSGDATAADNLEAACDGTGYNLGGGSIVAASVTAAPSDSSGVSTLLDRLSATRAGYLDALADLINGGRLDLLIDAIKAKTDNLPAAPAAQGDIPSASAIADAVFDEALSGHATAGTAGAALAGAAPESGGNLATLISRLTSTRAGYLDNLVEINSARMGALTDLINGGRLDLLIDAIKAKTDNIATAAEIRAAILEASTSGFTAGSVGAALHYLVNTTSEEVDDIKAKTDALPGSIFSYVLEDGGGSGVPASFENVLYDLVLQESVLTNIWEWTQALYSLLEDDGAFKRFTAEALEQAPSGGLDAAGIRSAIGLASANLDTLLAALATSSALATVAGYIDNEVAAIKAKTDNLPSDPADESLLEAAIAAAPPSVAAIAAGILDHLLTGHATADTVGAALIAARLSGDPLSNTVVPGAYAAGTAGAVIGSFIVTARTPYTPGLPPVDAFDIAERALKMNHDLISTLSATTFTAPVNKAEILVSQFYDDARREVLQAAPWTCIAKRVPLTATKHEHSTAYAVGDVVYVSGASVFQATVAGTSAATDPTWPASGTVADGTVTWKFLYNYIREPDADNFTGKEFAFVLPEDYIRQIEVMDAEGNPIDFLYERQVFYADEETPTLLYVPDDNNVELWDPLLAAAVVVKLAQKIAYPLTGDKEISLIHESAAERALPKAAGASRRERKQGPQKSDPWYGGAT